MDTRFKDFNHLLKILVCVFKMWFLSIRLRRHPMPLPSCNIPGKHPSQDLLINGSLWVNFLQRIHNICPWIIDMYWGFIWWETFFLKKNIIGWTVSCINPAIDTLSTDTVLWIKFPNKHTTMLHGAIYLASHRQSISLISLKLWQNLRSWLLRNLITFWIGVC